MQNMKKGNKKWIKGTAVPYNNPLAHLLLLSTLHHVGFRVVTTVCIEIW